MSNRTNEQISNGVRSLYGYELNKIIEFVLKKIPVSDRAELEVFASRIAKASVFVAIKSGLNPVDILTQEMRDITLTDQFMEDCSPEIFPRLPRRDEVSTVSQDEAEKLAEPIRQSLMAMSLAGVPAQVAAGILMTFAAQVLLQDSDGNARAVALAFAAFGREVDRSVIGPNDGSSLGVDAIQ